MALTPSTRAVYARHVNNPNPEIAAICREEMKMDAKYILDNLDDIWSGSASADMNIARNNAHRKGHKYRVVDREGFRAALKRILEDAQ